MLRFILHHRSRLGDTEMEAYSTHDIVAPTLEEYIEKHTRYNSRESWDVCKVLSVEIIKEEGNV